MNNKYLFMDTSALMHATIELKDAIEEENVMLVVCSTVLEELDRHKDCDNGEKKYKARQAFKLINNHPDNVKYIVDEVPDKFISETLFYGFDMKKAMDEATTYRKDGYATVMMKQEKDKEAYEQFAKNQNFAKVIFID